METERQQSDAERLRLQSDIVRLQEELLAEADGGHSNGNGSSRGGQKRAANGRVSFAPTNRDGGVRNGKASYQYAGSGGSNGAIVRRSAAVTTGANWFSNPLGGLIGYIFSSNSSNLSAVNSKHSRNIINV